VFDRRPISRLATPATGTAVAVAVRDPAQPAADASAASIALRARIARPLAALVAGASSLAAGAWSAALLAVLVEPSSGGERALIAVIAFGVVAGVGALHLRGLRHAWRSGPAVTRHIRPFTHALLAGILTAGGLALLALGSIAVFGAAPIGATGQVVWTGAAAAVGLGWRRWKLDERVRRRIG
jgi:hypothetical protein